MLLRNPRSGETVETYGMAAEAFKARGWQEVPRKRRVGRPRKDERDGVRDKR